MSNTVTLELNSLFIDRPKERWKIYFVIIAEHPTDNDKMVLSVVPNDPMPVRPGQNNKIDFGGDKPGEEGLLLLRRKMPESRDLNVHCYVRHSRSDVRDIGAILSDIEKGIGKDAIGLLSNILGTTNPWLAITKKALPIVGKVLSKIKDREMGFISMYERFGPEFEEQEEIDIQRTGGFSTVVYSWSIS
jgi:hypothetical protein